MLLEEQRLSVKKSLILLSQENTQKNSEILNHSMNLSQSTIPHNTKSSMFESMNPEELETSMAFSSSFFIKSPPNSNPLNLNQPNMLNKSVQTSKRHFFKKLDFGVQTKNSGITQDCSTQVTDMVPEEILEASWPFVTCDVCRTRPLKGIRYKCNSCNDYDLCRGCYLSTGHGEGHDMTRMLKR